MLVIDDEALVRHALRIFVDAEHDMSVIGEAADGLEAVTFATDQRPDVVLMDIQMPRMNGVDATRRIIEASPDARILAITTFSSQQHVSPPSAQAHPGIS